MTAVQTNIANEILTHVSKQGGPYKSWYAGIASDPETRLFVDHNVSRSNAWWVYRKTPNANDARAIEDYLLSLGFVGGPGGGDQYTDSVYAYLITSTTRE